MEAAGSLTQGKGYYLTQFSIITVIVPHESARVPLLEEANWLFYQCLWSGKSDRVKRNIVIRDIQHAWLKMVDIDSMAWAQSRWACKSYSENDSKWCGIINSFFTQVKLSDFTVSAFHEAFLPWMLPCFYTQCLIALSELYPRENFNLPTIPS